MIMTKIKAVTFDLWQTLIYETVEQEALRKQMRAKAMTDLLNKNGIKVEYDRFDEAHQEALNRCETFWAKDRDISIKDQVVIFLQCVNHKIEWAGLPDRILDELIAAFTEPIMHKPPYIFEDTIEILSYLHKKGLKIGLICNTGRTPGVMLRKVLKQLNILQYLNTLTFSNELLIRKPDLRIFMHTLSNLEVNPMQSIHIGDNPIADVTGAKNAGMLAVWRRGEDLRPSVIPPDFQISKLIELVNII
jgi:FMN phosphatase YigB (HAD superfamily)